MYLSVHKCGTDSRYSIQACDDIYHRDTNLDMRTIMNIRILY